MVIIRTYRLEAELAGVFALSTAEKTYPARFAAKRFWSLVYRRRKFIEADGSVKTLLIRRLRCDACGKIHHELPDILVPYKRHCAETIEKIIKSSGEMSRP